MKEQMIVKLKQVDEKMEQTTHNFWKTLLGSILLATLAFFGYVSHQNKNRNNSNNNNGNTSVSLIPRFPNSMSLVAGFQNHWKTLLNSIVERVKISLTSRLV